MAIALVTQTTAFASATTSKVVTITSPTSGDCLVMSFGGTGFPQISGVSGGGVTTWTLLKKSGYSNFNAELWFGIVDTTPSTSVTITFGATSTGSINLSEWSGIKTSGAADATSTSAATTTTKGAGSITASTYPSVVISVAFHNSTTSPSGGPTASFTALTEAKDASGYCNNTSYRIWTGAPSAVDPEWTIASQDWEGVSGVLLGATGVTSRDPFGMSGFFGV